MVIAFDKETTFSSFIPPPRYDTSPAYDLFDFARVLSFVIPVLNPFTGSI